MSSDVIAVAKVLIFFIKTSQILASWSTSIEVHVCDLLLYISLENTRHFFFIEYYGSCPVHHTVCRALMGIACGLSVLVHYPGGNNVLLFSFNCSTEGYKVDFYHSVSGMFSLKHVLNEVRVNQKKD